MTDQPVSLAAALAGLQQHLPCIASRQLSIMHAKFAALGITDRAQRLNWTQVVTGRLVESANDLSYREARQLLEALTEEARERNRS